MSQKATKLRTGAQKAPGYRTDVRNMGPLRAKAQPMRRLNGKPTDAFAWEVHVLVPRRILGCGTAADRSEAKSKIDEVVTRYVLSPQPGQPEDHARNWALPLRQS